MNTGAEKNPVTCCKSTSVNLYVKRTLPYKRIMIYINHSALMYITLDLQKTIFHVADIYTLQNGC